VRIVVKHLSVPRCILRRLALNEQHAPFLRAHEVSRNALAHKHIFGARGEELRRSSGLSEIEYESKRKKIRRRLEKYLSDVNS
jgi:hypothetical protein